MKNLHAFSIKYLGATNNNGSRVKITSERFNESKTIAYDHSKNNIVEIAEEFLKANGFDCVYQAETREGHLILSTTFNHLKK